MKLKLDETVGTLGKALLEADGHDVMTVAEQGLSGAPDEGLYEYRRAKIMTQTPTQSSSSPRRRGPAHVFDNVHSFQIWTGPRLRGDDDYAHQVPVSTFDQLNMLWQPNIAHW